MINAEPSLKCLSCKHTLLEAVLPTLPVLYIPFNLQYILIQRE